ncbi:hypothetical protein NQ318_010096 [Aromia moschata]|uniref:Uncharacterized protein n=1 Tax=Aromia moschata TaxID=1265417 RepID=A0AAV8Y868_9CUCU|nr:hypothetical protein NQ318_010096 [Aromia moschata]
MLKIRALNKESSSDEDVPVIRREAQNSTIKALRLLALEGSQAESILLKLVDENIPLLENNGGLPKSMSTLKYSCFVNLGNIYLKENKVNEALEKYLTASELDSTDVTLWYKIGKLSLKEEKFRQSAYAFSKYLGTPLDVDIDEEDEKKYLEEAQVLQYRYQKALEDHTWLSLAKTVTYLHQYMTDNEMEQNMDQDIEEPAENSESKAERGRPRGSKRKRDLLSDLQIWGWHSKRKQSKKAKEKDFTVEDALNRIIPKTLLHNKIDPEKYNQMEDSMDTMDLYNLYVEDHNLNYLSPIHSPKSVNYEPYFGTDRESEDVSQFWTKKRDYCDAVVLVKELVFALSKLWTYKWPKELVPLYVGGLRYVQGALRPPEVFCGDSTFQEIRNDALATILYGGTLVSGWEDQWQHEYESFFNRVFWLRSHIFRKENSNDLAIRSLELVQEVIAEEEAGSNERYLLSLPNCFRYGLITNQIAEKIIKHLEMINSLGTVEGLFNAERYTEVADILKLTFNASGNHPQVGRMEGPRNWRC